MELNDMNGDTVFELEPILDNPLFEGLAAGETPSLLGRTSIRDDFFPNTMNDWQWTLEPLVEKWHPLVVEGRTRSFNDFPCLGMLIPAFSRRAADVLHDYLEPNGELLPLVHPAGQYYAYNCLTIVEVLDHANTVAPWRKSQPMMTQSIDYYAIHASRLAGLTIFRMREMPNRVFVTTPFVDRVYQHGLNGFHFVKVWPFPQGVDYKLEDKKKRLGNRRVDTPAGSADVKAQSIVIRLPLPGGKLSPDLKKRIETFEDEIDAQLFTPTLDTPYFGSLEGKKTAKGVTELFLSCPDSEALYNKLADWLTHLDWEPRPTAVVRRIPFDDIRDAGRTVEI